VALLRRRRRRRREKVLGAVLRCPQCGSTNIYYENALITGYKYHCADCDYVGAFIIEEEEGTGSEDDGGETRDGGDERAESEGD